MDEIVFDRLAVDRLIAIYEDVRTRSGFGTMLHRVTPSQRLDALHVCLAVAAGGIAPGTGTRAFWLRHLTPVLAETGDSVRALNEALDLAFPPSDQRVSTPVPSWARFRQEARRTFRQINWIVSPAMAGVSILSLLFLILIIHSSQPPTVKIDSQVESPKYQPQKKNQQTFADGGQSALARAYRETLMVAVATLREHKGSATPSTLARTFAAAFPQVGSPSNLLAELILRYPLAPEEPIPQTAEGSLAVHYYAFVAAERLAPGSADDMVALFKGDSLLETLQSGEQTDATPAPTAERSAPNGYRFLPFLIVLLGSVWALRPPASAAARKRDEIIAMRAARRAGAGLWAEARIMQTGTDSLPPLPTAGRVARTLIGLREPQPGNRLDEAHSVRATLQSAGDFVTVMRPRSRAVEFVFLIRRRNRHDHERARALRLVNALSNAGLTLTAYDYGPDPRFLTATTRIGAGNSPSPTTLDLRGLRERHFGAVLILITDGDEMLDPLTLCPLSFVKRELAAWSRRMILTPTPTAAWGDREYRLATALNAPIGRATIEGLADLALVFDFDAPEAKALRPLEEAQGLASWGDRVSRWRALMTAMLAVDPLPIPPLILTVDDGVIVSDCAPSEQVVGAVIFSLRLWLGHGFTWFVATAVHPQLRFDVTLWLGAQLTRKATQLPVPPRDLGASQYHLAEVPLFSENLLDRLCLLPWFRQGRIPIWLRKAAFEQARDREKAAARSAIERLLQRTSQSDREGAASLPVWLADWRGQKLASDDTMIGFRSDIPLLQESSFEMTAEKINRRRWITLVAGRLVALAVWAAVASSLIPPSNSLQLNGAWVPLTAFVATSLGLCLLAAFPSMRAIPKAIYRKIGRRAIGSNRAETEEVSS